MPSPDNPQASVVLIEGDAAPEVLARIAAIVPDAEIRRASAQDMAAAIADADIVLGTVPPDALARASRLKWVHSHFAGPDRQLYPEFIASPALLTCNKGNGAVPLAEHAMLLMLMLNRNALRWIEAQREHRWDRTKHGELNGLTCGILGAGYSAQDLALKAKAFHMRVVGLRRSDAPAANFDRMYERAALHDFLAESDFVVVTVPRTPQTVGMLGEAEFRAMKPSAFYICFSRGGIADDAALLRALTEGWIAGAGLDAHSEEPLPADSPFWDAPNTIVTPHNGATTPQTSQRGVDIFIDNLARFVRGDALVNLVDKQHGY